MIADWCDQSADDIDDIDNINIDDIDDINDIDDIDDMDDISDINDIDAIDDSDVIANVAGMKVAGAILRHGFGRNLWPFFVSREKNLDSNS